MPIQRFISRLQSHSTLDEGDVRSLEGLAVDRRNVAAGNFIIRAGTEAEDCSLLSSGIAFGQQIAGNGARQILSMFFPGEIVDFDGLLLRPIDHNVEAKTRCELIVFGCEDMLDILFARPAIGKAIMREAAIKAAIAREWMTNVGRRDSSAKVAHFLCELLVRLSPDRPDNGGGFELPITQEQIADVVGITPMHVGRVLKNLEEAGLIRRDRKVIDVLNWERLKSTGDFSSDYLRIVETL